jgi:hypothetical protein
MVFSRHPERPAQLAASFCASAWFSAGCTTDHDVAQSNAIRQLLNLFARWTHRNLFSGAEPERCRVRIDKFNFED